MNESLIFTALLAFTVLFPAAAGVFFLRMNEQNLPFWEKLPRNRNVGGVIGILALLCFIPNVRPLFSPEKNLYWLIPAALVLGFLCYWYLDHLFARAWAGGMILLVHYLLAGSFSRDLAGRGFFALLCFIAGSIAILIAAKPYWMRDCFRLMCRKRLWRCTGAALAFLWSLSAVLLLIGQIGKGV